MVRDTIFYSMGINDIRMSEEMRLPLYKLSSEHRDALVNELRKQQLI